MKLKKLLAAVTAAALAVTTMAFTVNADGDVRLSLGSMGAAELVQTEWSGDSFGLPTIELDSCWGNPKSFENYNSIEIEYTCSNLSEVMNVYLAIDGGTLPEWTSVWTPPSASGKITLDLSSFRDCTYEVISVGAQPIDGYKTGDTFNPGITVKSAKFVMTDKILPTVNFGAAVLPPKIDDETAYDNPGINLEERWGWADPAPIMGYGSIELEYTCSNVSDVDKIYLSIYGGTIPGWTAVWTSPFEQGKIVLDLSSLQNYTYEAISIAVVPNSSYAVGDVFDPGIVVTSAKLVSISNSALNILTTGSMGSSTLTESEWTDNEYGTPMIDLDVCWGHSKSLSKYSAIEVEYTCSNLSEVEYIVLAINGGTIPEWTEKREIPSANGKITLDLSELRKYSYEEIAFGVNPIDGYSRGDVFNPGITITSAKLINAEIPNTTAITFADGEHKLNIGKMTYEDGSERKVAVGHFSVPAPSGFAYGVTTVGELRGKTIKLEGIDFKNCSLPDIIANDVIIGFSVQVEDGNWYTYYSGTSFNDLSNTIANETITYEKMFGEGDNGNPFWNQKIQSIGYSIWIDNEVTNKMELEDTVTINTSESIAPPQNNDNNDTATPSSESTNYPTVIPIGGSSETTAEQAVETINSAAEGTEIEISVKGNTSIAKDIIAAIAGKDVDVQFTLNGGVTVEINGLDIENAKKVDLGVRMNKNKIDKEKINEIAGNKKTIQFSLKHNGDFGFKATFNLPVNKKYNGKFANIYWDNHGKLEYVGSSKIINGKTSYVTTHASDYVIVVDDYAYGEDVSSAAGAYADNNIL